MNLFNFLLNVISLIYLLSFLYFFLPLQFSKPKTAFVLALCFWMVVSCDFMIYKGMINNKFIVLTTILEASVTQSSAVFISSLNRYQSLFVGVSASCYVLIGNVMGAVVYVESNRILPSVLTLILVHTLVICILNKILRDKIHMTDLVTEKMWKYLCLIPIVFYITEYSINIWPGNVFTHPSNAVTSLLLLLLLEAAYVVVIKLLRSQRNEGELKHNNSLLINYADSLKHEAELLKKSDDSMRIYRHDMRHKMRAIAGYIAQDRKDDAIRAIEETVDGLDVLTPARYCKNLVINGILDQWSKEAEQNHIKMVINADIAEHLSIEEFKLAVILSNLLENAQQATMELPEEQRWTHLNIRPTKGRLIIEISNSYDQSSISSDDFSTLGLPVSKKGVGHGFGLKSVYTFAQLNGGMLDCTCDHGIFCIRLLLNDVAESGEK